MRKLSLSRASSAAARDSLRPRWQVRRKAPQAD